ncbi:TetR/AcrR family transcriptional regulator [Bacillus velezensis]|uniref:TetR/AcrR family transcriptional regulator n=1 Tax=Bacillus TaxID=1386 RepID=UPI0005005A12|nr:MULTISPECIES: TetR/AcrR family transcriptional regulator [Bacillus]ARM26691.1 TetR family transcriptional regulator [Bacillus vallismortis]ANF35284.1 putative transcriptional regulator (TetR/AcrR family) [Bacillus velezensis]ANS37224.1 TetR family transcriptional regulator [Bacillus velezensis]ANU28981.1 TetR family transcriptional regulator [Bacillus velezensis]APQ50327.1 TetR family transcriptional regulator [Bacillus amyloliquefaciens]
MNDKKTDILLAARKLFSGKSFSSVSMQAIAEECKVSKASLYKLFESKEDLLLELLDFNQKQMVAAASLLNEETSLSPEERFAKKLMAELEGFRRNQQFFNMLMYGSPSSINERVKRHIHRARSTFICWHRDSLIQTYGEDIIPYVWELVIVLQGLLRECITLIKLEKEPLALEPLTEFIIRHLNLIVENRTTETALPQEMIDLYIASASSFEPKDKTVLLAESLKELKEAVSVLPEEKYDVAGLASAAAMLEKESADKQPRDFLIKALIGYLEQAGPLHQPLAAVKTLLKL